LKNDCPKYFKKHFYRYTAATQVCLPQAEEGQSTSFFTPSYLPAIKFTNAE